MNILKKTVSAILSGILLLSALITVPLTVSHAVETEDEAAPAFSGSVNVETNAWYRNTPRFSVTTSSGYETDGYCVEPAKTPPSGEVFESKYISAVVDETVRNVMYFGYNNPGFNMESFAFSTGNNDYPKTPKGAMRYFRVRDNLASGLSENAYFYTFTHYAAAYAMYGSDIAFGVNPGYEEYTYKKAVTSYVAAIQRGIQEGTLQNKSELVRVYLINKSAGSQNIIFPVFKMRLEFDKISTNPQFTDNNTAYSLEGAQFVLFQNNKEAAEKAAKQPPKTDARKANAVENDGNVSYIYTNSIGVGCFKNFKNNVDDLDYAIVDIDEYRVVEYTAPKGYEVNNQPYSFTDSGQIDENGFPVYRVSSTFKNSKGDSCFPETPKMVIKMTKRSADTSITEDNTCYSLEGAEYLIYTDSACKNPLSLNAIVTDASGNGSYLEAQPINGQELWAKETKASPGYALDETIHKLTDSGERDSYGYPIYTFTSVEKPETDPITVLLQKYDATTGKGTNTEKLANAEFTVKFYPAYYYSVEEIGDTQPLRSWVFKTNRNGKIQFDERDKVSGDEFWYDEGYPSLPYGTITVQETKAPIGYQINPDIYLANIDDSNGKISWRTTNENIDGSVLLFPETPENGELKIRKIATDNQISGVWFRVTAEGFSKDFCTDEIGLISNDELGSLSADREYTVEELGVKKNDGTYYYPKRYGQKPEPQKVMLQPGQITTVAFNNSEVPAELNVIKTSDDGMNGNVYFKLQSSDGTEYPLLVTDQSGMAVVALPIYDADDNLIRYTVSELGFSNGDGTYSIPERYVKPKAKSFTLVDKSTDVITEDKVVKSVMFHNSMTTGAVTLHKRDGNGKALAGSQWQLFKETTDEQIVSFVQTGVSRYQQKDNGQVQTMSTNSNGDLYIVNLEFGDYYLLEVKAPSDMQPYGEKISFTISGDSEESLDVDLTVIDNKAVLFNTGSVGVKPFYIVGAISLASLMVGLGAYFFIKKKKIKTAKNRSEK